MTIRIPRCKGANYHVFTLGASHCSICGWDRYAEPKPKKEPA